MSQALPSLQATAHELAAMIRAGFLPIPGTAAEPLLEQLEADAGLTTRHEADETASAGLSGRLRPIPGTVLGPLRIAAAGGAPTQLLTALGRAFGIQRSHRSSLRLVLTSTVAISSLAVIGTLFLTAFNRPLIDQQQLLHTGRSQPPAPFLTAAFGGVPVVAGLAVVLLLAGFCLVAAIIGARRQLDWSLARWLASEAHEALRPTDLPDNDRRAIVRELLAGWCQMPPGSALDTTGLLGMALATQRPQQASALTRAVCFHRRQGDRLETDQNRLLPMLGSLVTGLAVLLYGIALMQPLAGLFETLATVPVVTFWEATR